MRVLSYIAVLVAALMVFAIGCTTRGHPIMNVENAPVPAGKPLTMDDVQKAILRAGPQSGWVIQPERPGRLVGRATFGAGDRHVAVVEIQHDAKTYSIKYRESVNLAVQPAENTIHRAYNDWVARLDRAIRSELQR